MKIKIEKGIPLPTLESNVLETLPKMEVGDSFAFPSHKKSSIYGYAKRYKKENKGWSYTIKTLTEECRLWRIK